MRAFQITSLDQPGQVIRVEAPKPGPGQVRLDIHACGLNFADLLMARGQYQERPPLPFTLGMEPAGVVTEIGADVTHLAPGDRVACFASQGGLAEAGVFDAATCTKIPDAMDFTDAAAFQVAYGTAHVALGHRARLRPGETLLVLGAAGGVGMSAIETGKLMGARVIACARGADKLKVCASAGADHLIDSASQDLRAEVKALGGADVVFDPVGGDQFRAALGACRPEARMIVVGFASGEVPQIPANILLVKNISVLGYYWGGYLRFRPEVLQGSLTTLFGWYADGRLKPHVSHVLPLEEAAAGYELLRARRSTGKVVIRTSEPA
ncbi:MAG TPA: NADPH:quinone oxidoreductase family protein [Aliiroseovarius sp.]|nr:NADPH:quinone oxidoreductase family protein [Aliiroseovarius sp.]